MGLPQVIIKGQMITEGLGVDGAGRGEKIAIGNVYFAYQVVVQVVGMLK